MKQVLAACLGLAMTSSPVFAQDLGLTDDLQTEIDQIIIEPLNGGSSDGLSLDNLQTLPQTGLKDVKTHTQARVSQGTGAKLRALDKLTGEVADLSVKSGQAVIFGRMTVYLQECRYPSRNAAGDAYAYVTIAAEGYDGTVFSGWMVASSPALNAMDHARYDLWPLSCSTS
jgi:hypothetical protein